MIKQKISTKLSLTYTVLKTLFIGIAAVIFYKYNQYNIHQEQHWADRSKGDGTG
ncbi:MAG: hypothetical protein RHS_4975 [Robinsoniella sp. RHS]|uniref:hypothetical protein n=1 Tax=Robinsoniella sp. RHS TaxID=1504536 RepID=UPI00065A094A|nr:MAG: hypothetical protein RHS_4975 [Robinsoniella sp. RHS]